MPISKFLRVKSWFTPSGYLHLGDEMFMDVARLKKLRLTPTLFIIGAQKCGTSSMHAYLDEHPEIFMSKPRKEPGYYVPWPIIQDYYKRKNTHFSSRIDLLQRGMLKGYRNERIIGESSTFYSNGTYNITREQWRENNVDLDRIRIIYLMKNPIDRIVSHYLHALRYNDFVGDINKFVQDNPEAIGISCYGKQISYYFEYLNTDQVLLMNFESLINEPQIALKKACNFLGVKPFSKHDFAVFNASPNSQSAIRNSIQWHPHVYQKMLETLQADSLILGQFANLDEYSWNLQVSPGHSTEPTS